MACLCDECSRVHGRRDRVERRERQMCIRGSGSTYDIRGVVVHQGDVVREGHYRAFVCARDKTWFHCNDARKPQVVTEAEVLSAEAYILCYEKR